MFHNLISVLWSNTLDQWSMTNLGRTPPNVAALSYFEMNYINLTKKAFKASLNKVRTFQTFSSLTFFFSKWPPIAFVFYERRQTVTFSKKEFYVVQLSLKFYQ